MARIKTFERDGFNVTLWTEPEPDLGSPAEESDRYTPKQVQAWERREWWWVQLAVVVRLDGLALGMERFGAAVEEGRIPVTNDADEVRDDPVLFYDPTEHPEDFEDFIDGAIKAAREILKTLVQAWADAGARMNDALNAMGPPPGFGHKD